MSLIWQVFTVLLVLAAAGSAIILVLGLMYLLVFSIVEYIEAKLDIISIGEKEEELIAQAEKLREEQRKAFEGPWTLEARVRPYSSKAFRFSRAREILEKRSPGKS
jgi:hypothetical protein